MRKVFILYLVLLLGLFALLFTWDRKGDYVIEKKIWRLYQQQLDIAKDPAVIPDRTFEDLVIEYRKVIARYPDSALTSGIYLRLGEIYGFKGDYEAAREAFNEAIGLYPDDREFSAEALLRIGKTYESEQDWVEASKIYNRVISEYSETDTAMGVPVYIANYYKGRNDFQQTMEAYEVAIRYYKKMASDHDGTRTGLNALRYLSNCYLEQNRWNEAINTLGTVIEKYAGSGFLAAKDIDMTVKTVNIVSAYQLRDFDVAIRLYQGIIDRNPDHRLRGYLERVIDAFRQLREKGVEAKDLK